MENKTYHIQVSGKVQGVAFRHYTKMQADRIGINGWVRNRRDGSVEAVISGPEEKLEEMIIWLHSGPPSSVVTQVNVSEIEKAEPFDFFDIRY